MTDAKPAPGKAEISDEESAFEVFRHDAAKALTTIKITAINGKFRRAEDLPQYLTSIHGLIHILAVIGESELSRFAEKLEDAARKEDIIYLLSKTVYFAEKLDKLIKASPGESGAGE